MPEGRIHKHRTAFRGDGAVKEKTMGFRQRLALTGIALGVVAGLTTAIVSIGTETRWPDILTLYFSGFASGASLVAAFRRRPASRATGNRAAAGT
jgi:hypothetical protein